MTAGVHDERLRRQQRFDILEQQRALLAPRDQARRRRVQDERDALSTSAVSAGMPASRAARSARASAARAVLVCRRRIAIPATTSSWAARNAGGNGAGSNSASSAFGLVEAPDQKQAADLEIARMRGVHPVAMRPRASSAPRRAPSAASPGRARPARSRPRRRRTARGPRPLSGRRRAPHCRSRALARARSPSCAMAMPRSASAGASSRSATRFSAPSGSPAASARAAAVISESIGIPPHLSLSPLPPSGTDGHVFAVLSVDGPSVPSHAWSVAAVVAMAETMKRRDSMTTHRDT